MRIAFNPSTVAALTTPPNNKDITFDLRGQNIFARGVKFCGTDTNTWRDIKINNVSIGSNTLDLRDGDNTTLTNINGVVTINSTWRPVVDNLTSDSTTSSLSANLGRVLVGLINGKSDSEHNHDDRYLRLTGGIMQLGKGLKFHADNSYFGTDLDARIISLLDSNNKICNGGLIIDERTTLDDKEYVTELLRIRDSEFKWKGNNILHSGNSYIKENTITINGISTTWENTWRTVSVNDVSIGKAPLNIKAGNGISLSESNGTITVTSTSSTPNILLHQFLSSTDTTWYPLIWGGNDHNNTSDSTGAVYKSYDKLSWLTSTQTLYATRMRTTSVDLNDNRGIFLVTPGGTSPYKGIRLPDLQSNGIGMFSKIGSGDGTDEGGIIISADTSVIYNSFDTGWGLTIRDKDRGLTDISGDNTIAFGIRQDYRAYSLGGFEKSGSNNSYVLLGGGGHKLESSLNVANADKVDGYHASKFPYINNNGIWRIYGNAAVAALADNTAGLSSWAFGESRNYGITYLGILKPSTYTCGINAHGTIAVFGQGDTHLGIASDYGIANLQVFGGNADKIVWRKKVAFTDSNVASATKLQTPRTIWSQRFDGTADIPISVPAKMPYLLFKRYDNDEDAGYIGRGSTSNNNIYIQSYINENIILDGNSVGIGTYHPSEKLHVSGNIYSTGDIKIGGAIRDANNEWLLGGTASEKVSLGSANFAAIREIANINGKLTLSAEGNTVVSSSSKFGIAYPNTNELYNYFEGGDKLQLHIGSWTASKTNEYVFRIMASNGGAGEIPALSVAFNGNVGINNSYPKERLSVDGNILATGGFRKNGSSDAYVLLGGGGHKPLSEFLLGSGSYLPYNGWWGIGNGLDVNDSNGMIFAYASHKNSPFSSYWGIITTFDYTYNSTYKFLLAANCYSNAMYYRSRSNERGGWASWALVIDTGNIGSLRVAYATSAGSVDWSNVTGKPTIPNPANYYWANIKVSASSNTQTQPSVNTIYANNWFRSKGNSGWFSESYGGGIYMVDTSWIRTYNGKGFYCDNLIYSSNSIRMGNILLEHNNEINNDANGILHLNYRNTGNISLCCGGGNVGVGTTGPSYKLDVNGLVRASGFHHGSINSDNYILLAGGGYKSYGGSASNPIFLGYLDLYHGNNGTIDSYFYCLGYSVPFTYTRGGNYCKISIPNTTYQVFYIKAAIASVNYSGGGIDNWTGEHRGDGAWWLHCYASGNNDVRVKGFHNSNGDNDSWWGGNPLYSGSGSANVITVCLFGYVNFK